MKQTESALQSAIIDFVQWQYPEALILRTNSGGTKTISGGWVWFIRWWARLVVSEEQHSGACDVHVVYKGKTIAIECKVDDKKPRPKQLQYAEAVEIAGGIYCLAYSIDDVKNCMESLS